MADLRRTVVVLVEVRAVFTVSRRSHLHTESKSYFYRVVVPSGTEAPVVPSRMTLSVECPSAVRKSIASRIHRSQKP